MIIYNVFPLLAGPVSQWAEHITRASKMGFSWIFVNPVQQVGSSGSLYSISDYFSLNSSLFDATTGLKPEQQLKKTIEAAEKMGVHSMIDLVISHCAADSKLVQEYPQWFAWEGKGRVCHPHCNQNGKKVVWRDLAKFDHRHTRDKKGLTLFCLRIIEHLIQLGFKGFRCDAAYQVPHEFWQQLISITKKKYPGTIFVAETLGCAPDLTRETAAAGFDYIFNSAKWWDYQASWLMDQYDQCRDIARSVSFPESHDTVRLCEELQGNIEGMKQRYLFTALFSAGVMMPMGFEFGFRKKLHVVQTTPEDWEHTSIDLCSFIARVNEIKKSYTVFLDDGPIRIIKNDNPQVLIMWKGATRNREEALVILNKDIYHRQYIHLNNLYEYIRAGVPLVDISPEYCLKYLPTPFSYELRPGQGIVLVAASD